MKKQILVVKASGEKVPFSREKLIKSLKMAGSEESVIKEIIAFVESQLHDGITTKKIYKMAFSKLKQNSSHIAGRYKLKAAIMELGPSGFAFEKFIAEIFKQKGYQVEVGVFLKGVCVTHEIDVIATNHEEQNFVECKYHNKPGIVCDVKIPLYVHSRFRDVQSAKVAASKQNKKNYIPWIATNTKFSSDAIQYATCSNMKLLGWDYPKHGNLKELIDQLGLYPVTCINSLTIHEKNVLLQKDIILSRDIFANQNVLAEIGILPQRASNIVNEIKKMCVH